MKNGLKGGGPFGGSDNLVLQGRIRKSVALAQSAGANAAGSDRLCNLRRAHRLNNLEGRDTVRPSLQSHLHD
jgi:hypothetical protein